MPQTVANLLIDLRFYITISVTSKKSPNGYKSRPKIIPQEKLMILTTLQKLHKNVGVLGKLTQSPTNHPIWSH